MKRLSFILLFTFVWQLQAQQSDFETISFRKADNNAMQLKGEELTNLPQLAFKLTENLETDVERFRAIYYWVCHNIKSDYNLMMRNEWKRKKFKNDSLQLAQWNETFNVEVLNKLISDKRTLCTGYTYIIQLLANMVGIECEMVYGYGKTGNISLENMDYVNHSWNAVKLNDKWYLCDPTWSSGFIDATFIFHFNYNDDYFLMDPKDFAVGHLPLDPAWSLINTVVETNEN